MATQKKAATKKGIKVRDLKPSKDAKGGGGGRGLDGPGRGLDRPGHGDGGSKGSDAPNRFY
jgi:hypothetical protein